MKAIIFLFMVSLSLEARAQDCGLIYAAASKLFRNGQYEMALKKLAAYKLCDPSGSRAADALIVQIYTTINGQKAQAIRQKQIADLRAVTIGLQKDSIVKENQANLAAAQALQINQLDPIEALKTVYGGLRFSPRNTSLLEIKRRIVANEVLRETLPGASATVTLSVDGFGDSCIVAGDADGMVRLWNTGSRQLSGKVRLFQGALSTVTQIPGSGILAAGNDSKDFRNPVYAVKWYDSKREKVVTVASGLKEPYRFAAYEGDSSHVLLASAKGTISRFSLADSSMVPVRDLGVALTGLQCWRAAHKAFYATPSGIYELHTGKEIYRATQNSFVTYLGFCQSTGDLYIGIGSDLILYSFITKREQMLYPIHKGTISSCRCAEKSGGFLTVSQDNYAVLWTSNGNLDRVLKGSKAELYDGYLSDDAQYAVTVGRRQINVRNPDTGTVKYWYLKGNKIAMVPEAHAFGGLSLVFVPERAIYVSTGIDDKIKVWDQKFRLLSERKFTSAGIKNISWDSTTGSIVFGTLDGLVGKAVLEPDGSIDEPHTLKVHASDVTGLQVLGDRIYSTGKDGVLYVQNIRNMRLDSVYFNAGLGSVKASPDGKCLLLAAGRDIIVYELATRRKKFYKQPSDVREADWISNEQFVAISGTQLIAWSKKETSAPLYRSDNNMRTEMTAMIINHKEKLIYTGTWTGSIVCWDYDGHPLYEFDQLTSLEQKDIVRAIAYNDRRNEFAVIDYFGFLSLFTSPVDFLRKLLGRELTIDIP